MNNDNLRRVHKTLLDNGYTPPTYEEFENDMQDDNNLRGVYETLKKEGYTPPEYEQFKSDMGFAKVDANLNGNADVEDNADDNANANANPNLNANPNAKPWEAKVAGVPSLYDIADKQREETPKMPNYRHEVSVDEEGGKISKPVVKMSAIGNTPQVAPVFKDYAGNEYDATDPKVLEEAKRQVTPIVNTPKAQEEPSLLESIGKSIGAGAVRAGTQMIDVLQQLSSNMYVEDPSSPTGFTRTQSYEEQIKDENNPLTQASSAGHTLADKWSKEAQPRQGKGFVDLIMDGDITGALQKGVATAGESLPTTLSWATPYTAILNAIGMAGGNYREYTLEDESIPAWKRASMAIGSAAFEQAVEKYADPVFKYIGGTKILKGAAKEASKEIVEEVTKNATETLAKRIYKGLTNVGKDALGEGAEEVVTTFGNDALGEVLDYIEGSTDYGVRAQWEKLKKENPNANLWDFSKQKAKEYGDSFIGGYLSGAYTSGTAQVTTKALQYATGAASEIDIEGKRGTKILPPVMDVAQAFDNGYSLEGQEMNDAMNMYDMQREKAVQVLGDDKVAELDANPVDAMAGIDTEEQLQVATDYVNAKATFDGMGQKVLDDINAQIAESDKNLNELTSKTDGKIHPVTLKGERKAHIVDGNVAVTDNGEIDAANSDLSILVRDDETGKIEFVSPSDIVTSDGAIDAEEEKVNVAQAIRDAVTQQADAQMNGILSFNVGDEYDVLDDKGNAHTIAVVDNGQEGQVLVSVDGENVARMMPRDEVQKMANNANLARLAEHEAKKETKRQMENGETSGEADNNNVGAHEPLAATPDAMPMIKNSEDPDFMATTPERGHRYLYDEAGIPKAAADNMVTAHINAAEKEVKKQSDALAKLDANPGTSISAYKAKQADIKGKLDAAQAAYDYWNGVKTEQGKRDEAERQAAFAAQTADTSGRQNELAAQKTPKEKIDAAKQMYGEYFDSDFTVPYDAMELVAMNMPNEKISWEGREGVRGLQQELGSNFKRGVGRDKGTNAFNIYLAKKGEGISTDEAIHSIYESAENTLPNGEHRWDVEEIRGAFIDMFMGAEKPSDIRDYVLNNRIRQAEQMRAAEDEAAEMARLDDEIMQRTGMEREEYAAWIAELEARADAQAAYENEVYNETNISNDRETEGSIGEEGSGQVQGQEGDTTGVEEDGAEPVADGGRNEGTQGDTTERQEGDLAQAKVTARLSSEVNEFDKPFVLASNGTTTFGEVSKDSGLTEAPIKLSLGENRIDEEGGNHGYGLLHIEAGHGEQIRAAGFNTVEEFVETVAKNYDTIREGGIVANNQTYLLEISDEHNNTLFIQLSRDGKYWNVNSAGIFKKKYSRRKQEVYTRPALEPGTNTDSRGVDSGLSDGVTAPAGNSPETSASKGTENENTVQENEVEISSESENKEEGQNESTINGAVDMATMQPVMGEEAFAELLESGDKETMEAYLKEIEHALRLGDNAPLDGQKEVRQDYKKAVEQYGKDNIPEEVLDELTKRIEPYNNLERTLFDRKYALEEKLRGVEAAERIASAEKKDKEKAAHKQTAYNGFLADKTALGADAAEKALSKRINIEGEVMTVAEFVEKQHQSGSLVPSISEEPKYKGVSKRAWNRMDAAQQAAEEERVKNGGTKSVYRLNGYELGKTAYDYAQYLMKNNNDNVDKVEKAKPNEQGKTETEKPQKSEKKSSARASSVVKIDDFGEKIGGARKDLARGRIRDIKGYTTKDLTTLKKGADDILSQANILRLYKDGQMDEQTARGFLAMNNAVKVAIKKYGRTAREIILNKYRDAAVAWEEGRAAEFGITDADVAAYMAGFDITEEKARKDLDYCITETFDMYMLTYQAMNYPAVERKLGQYVIVDYGSMRSGRIPLSRPFWVKTSYTSGRGYPFATLEGAMEKLNQLCPEVKPKDTEKKEKGEKAEHGLRVTKEGFGFYVKSRNIPGNIYLSPKFTSEKQAQAYMEENLEQLKAREQRLVDALMGSNIGMAEREGVDYRNGKDVTPQDFLDEFGFRGVEFGNWVPQGERQMYLNKTYDAIKDFCAIVGISPKAFSLGGRLGLAFGARGSGRALAHYEPGKEAINLTRMSGVGSLAHEWFHALDNILAKQETGNTSDMATMRNDVVREEVSAVLKEMYRVMKAMDYDMRSRRAGEYWGRTEEEFARLFENYIYNKLAEKEVTSPILVRKDILFDDAEEVSKNRWPYPSVAENATMAPLFDKLFSTIQEKTDEKGNVVLFQKLDGSTLSKEADATEMMMRDALVETMESAGIEVVTDVAIGQQVLDENADATREMRVYHGSGADFDAFDHSHMGEGEGAQAYGWGTYVTEVEGIGKTYAQSVGQNPIGRRPVLYKGESYDAVNTDGWSDEKKGVYVDLVQGMRVMGKSAEQAKDDLRLMTEVNIRNRERSLANLKVSSNTYQSIAEDKRKQEERLKHINEFNADDFTREGSTPTLYTVEIPEENAAYYIGYNERMREQQEIVEMADNELAAQGWKRQEIGEQMVFTNNEGKRIVFTPNQTGADFYEEFVVALGSKKAASEFLSSVGITGIKYPAEFRSGGRTDGASNYVIFDESDIEITNKARLFRTSNGEVYGYTMGGKIYLDTRIATTETPIHEYSHLWSEALEQANPKAWEQLKNDLVKDTELMDYVKGLYPEIKDENELMHEVFAHFSGKQGRARLEEMRKEETEKANGLLDKARIIAMFNRLKELLGRYWTMARDLFAGSVKGLDKMKAEDFADMEMADLLGGFNPSAAAKNNDIRYQFVGEQGAAEAVKMHYDALAQKYHGKPYRIVMSIDEMADEDFLKEIGFTSDELAELTPEKLKELAKEAKDYNKTRKVGGGYSPSSRRIVIFAENISSPDNMEEAFFHENLHGILHDIYGDNAQTIATRFWDVAEGGFVSKKKVADAYRNESEQRQKEEFFVYWLSRAMVKGRINEMLDMLVDEDSEKIDNILGIIGYDRRTEEVRRKDGKGQEETQGNHEQDVSRLLPTSRRRFREGKVVKDTYEESLASSKAAGYTKKQHDAWWNRAHKNMRLRANDIAKKLHLEGVVDIYETADDLNGVKGITKEDKKSKGWYDPKTGRIAIILGNHASAYDVMMTMLHEGVAHFGLRQLFGKNFETFLWNVYSNATPEVRSEINKLMAKNGWNYETATEEYLAGLAEDIDFDRVMKSGWWWKIKDWFVKMLRDIGLGSYVPEGKISDNELRYVLWRSYYNLELGGAYGTLLGAAIDVAKQYELGVGKFAPKEEVLGVAESGIGMSLEETNRRFNDELANLSEENADWVNLSLGMPSPTLLAAGVENKHMKLYGNKVIKKMKKHGFALNELRDLPVAVANPIAVFNNYGKDGNRSILTELKTAQGNILVAITIGRGDVDVDFNVVSSVFAKNNISVVEWINKGYATYINKEKALNYLHHSAPIAEALSDSRLSSAAKVVENFVNPKISAENVEKNVEKLHRSGDGTQEAYNNAVNTGSAWGMKNSLGLSGYNFREAFQDSMLALRKLQEVVEERYGIKLGEDENAYDDENSLSSRNQEEKKSVNKKVIEPMNAIVDKMISEEGVGQDELNDYLICKHGLERNVVMAERDARKKYDELVKAGQPADLNSLIKKYRNRDYSGLTGVTGLKSTRSAELAAMKLVYNFENNHSASCVELWEAINKATKWTLKKGFDSGMMSKETYDKVRNMFQYYVPLRGWDEETAEDVYDYLMNDRSVFNGTVVAAKGHSHKSDDPLAIIANMADSAILQGNRNQMKQKLLNMAVKYPTDVCSVGDMWIVKSGKKWAADFPVIPVDASSEEVAQIVAQHDADMRALGDNAKRVTGKLDVEWHINKKNIPEHAVVVNVGGVQHVVYINGNPRAAQAVNGLTGERRRDAKDKAGRLVDFVLKDMKRWYSSMLTQYNINFSGANYVRDFGHSILMTFINNGTKDTGRMLKYILPAIGFGVKARAGRVGNGEYDKYYKEFLENGGVTGYAHLDSVDKWKRSNDKRWERLSKLQKARVAPAKAFRAGMEAIGWFSETLELITRFNTYIKERKKGESIANSVKAAKNITVNFNKKGSEVTPGVFGAIANTLRIYIMFFNPIVQGINQIYEAVANNPKAMKRLIGVCGFYMILGAVMPFVNMALVENYGDDDDDYFLLNEYTRRTNFVLFTGKGYAKIPLPQFFREFYGMGEAIATYWIGEASDKDLRRSMVVQIENIFSIEGQEGYKEWSMTRFMLPGHLELVADIENNENFMGTAIWNESIFKQGIPEYQKAKERTWKPLVRLAKEVNELQGGTENVAGEGSNRWNANPAAWQHLLENYGGGLVQSIGDAANVITSALDGEMPETSNMPFAKRFYTIPTEESANWARYRMYKDFRKDYDRAEAEHTALNKENTSIAEHVKKIVAFEEKQPEAASIYYAWKDLDIAKRLKDAEWNSDEYWGIIREAVDAGKKIYYKDEGASFVGGNEVQDFEKMLEEDARALLSQKYSDGESRKLIESMIAKKHGAKYDEYSSAEYMETEYGKRYYMLRTFDDLEGDNILAEEIRNAKEDSDDVRRKDALDNARKDINKLKKRLGDPDEDDEQTMRDIRERRRDALKRFGKKSKE